MTGADYSDWGERVVSAELRGGLFYAHLSLYELAANFMHGKRVLDAGCGTGYGCAHLMRRGAASVLGVDFLAKAIDYCHQHFSGLGAMFRLLDLNQPLPFADESFDGIFSSNAMEHLAEIDVFIAEVRRT